MNFSSVIKQEISDLKRENTLTTMSPISSCEVQSSGYNDSCDSLNSQLFDDHNYCPVQNSKEYDQLVTLDLRTHIIFKLAQAVFPEAGILSWSYPRLHELMTYAQIIEQNYYIMSNSRKQYYELIADAIHKLKYDIEVKQQKRMEAITRSQTMS